MYYKKGLIIPALGTVLIIIVIISLMFVGAFSSSMEGGIIQKGGKAISLSNYAEFWRKSLDESLLIISRRSAYDLGETGGINRLETVVWNYTYPSMSILKTELENKIKENLPKGSIGTGRIVSFGEGFACINSYALVGDVDNDGDVDIDDISICGSAFGSYPEHPKWNSICDIDCDNRVDMKDIGIQADNFGKSDPNFENSKIFVINGNKSFSVYDKSIESEINLNHNFYSNISSSYFKLLFIGRQILENPSYNLLLNDPTSLESLLETDFSGLDATIETSGYDYSITLEDRSCLPNEYYCLIPLKAGEKGIVVGGREIPYNYVKLKFKVQITTITFTGVITGSSNACLKVCDASTSSGDCEIDFSSPITDPDFCRAATNCGTSYFGVPCPQTCHMGIRRGGCDDEYCYIYVSGQSTNNPWITGYLEFPPGLIDRIEYSCSGRSPPYSNTPSCGKSGNRITFDFPKSYSDESPLFCVFCDCSAGNLIVKIPKP